MKKIKLFVIFTLLAIRAFAPKPPPEFTLVRPEAINPYEKIWLAVCKAESNNDPTAVNISDPNGGSWGICQIGQLKLIDYNQLTGSSKVLKDMFNYQIAKQVFLFFADRIGPYNLEKIAKQWNGSGPMTIEYWKKVKACL